MDKEKYEYWRKKFEEKREKELDAQDKLNRSIFIPILASLIASILTSYLMK
ncbi:hypothetical protein ACSFB8_07615 [Enterococcus faecalis]